MKCQITSWFTILLCFGILTGLPLLVHGDLDILPINTAVATRYSFTLHCVKQVEGVTVSIDWLDPNNRKIVSNDKYVDGYDGMYDPGRGDSIIKSIFSGPSFSGSYECQATYSGSDYTHRGIAQVITLDDSHLKCIPTSSIVVEGDHFDPVCQIKYAGLWAPLLQWSAVSGDKKIERVVNETNNKMASYRLASTVHKGMSHEYKCTGKFDQPNYPLPESHATNTPIFNFKPCYVNITIHLPATQERINISPLKENYEVGETITCEAETNPPPSHIIWRDNDGGIISTTAEFTTLTPGRYHYACHVTNVVGKPGEERTVTAIRNVTFNVGSKNVTPASASTGVSRKYSFPQLVTTALFAFLVSWKSVQRN